jgi:hypothetical protein
MAYGVSSIAYGRRVVTLGVGTTDGHVDPVLACCVWERGDNVHDRVGSDAFGGVASAKFRDESFEIHLSLARLKGVTQGCFKKFVRAVLRRSLGTR